jgi:hypothetical protein
LLGAVVKVALQATALLVLGGHQTLARSPDLLDQPGVAKDQAGLGGQVGQELLGDARGGLGRRHGHGESAQQLALMADASGEIRAQVR